MVPLEEGRVGLQDQASHFLRAPPGRERRRLGRGGGRGRRRSRGRSSTRGRPIRGEVDGARAQQAQQAPLRLLGRDRHEADQLARAQRPVDSREHEAVRRRQRDRVHAKPRISGEGQLPVQVPEGLAHDLGVVQPPRGLEQQLAGRQPGRGVSLGQGFRQAVQLLERRRAVGPVERGEEDLPDVKAHCLLDARLVDQVELDEDGSQRTLVGPRRVDGPFEVGPADEGVPDEHIAEVLPRDVAPALDDMAFPDGERAHFRAVGDVEAARQARHVRSA